MLARFRARSAIAVEDCVRLAPDWTTEDSQHLQDAELKKREQVLSADLYALSLLMSWMARPDGASS